MMSSCPSIAVGPKAGGHHTMRSLSQVFSTSALLLVVQLEEQPRQTSTSLTPDHPKSQVISSPRECGPRTQASAISLPNSLSTALPAPVTLSLHLLPKPHACSSRAADVPKQVFLPSRPLLLSSLSLQLILSPPFLSVGILPDFPGLSGSTPGFPSYCTVLPALPLMVPRPH